MKQSSTKKKFIIVREVLKTGNYKKVALDYEITLRYWSSKIKIYGKLCLDALENKSRKPHISPSKIIDIEIINRIKREA